MILAYLKKHYRFLKGFSQAIWYNLSNRTAQYDLIILDDFFPNPLSSFRYTEFNYYFQNNPNTVIHTTGASWMMLNELTRVPAFIKKYNQTYSKNRVIEFNPYKKPYAKFCYVVFLSLTYQFLSYIEKHQLDFVFCLYPGGGFHLDTAETDKKLKAVCGSPYFKGVIVSQKITYDYLLKKNYCQAHQILYVFGVVLPIQEYTLPQNRPYYGLNKTYLDICFMANKYIKGGIDKGFDVFAEVARLFVSQSNIRFHVIGPYGSSDVETYDAHNIVFHGWKLTEALNAFFDQMDIILSPNRPFILSPGAFDGFPTGCCVEASIKGVAMFVSDPLDLNTEYRDGEEIEIIQPSADGIVSKIQYYQKHPERLRQLAINGQARTRILYSVATQLDSRAQFINEKLNKQENNALILTELI